jgi:leucyl-tRNA synthetase
MAPNPAKEKFIEFIVEKGWGSRKTNYHLRDWSVSRQRYWGTPIPIIYCDKCGVVPVPERDLPVELPYDVDFAPKGKPPLATAQEWAKVKCPRCRGDARRDVETMDTFVDSAWYFLRYIDPENEKELTDKQLVSKWFPVDIYFGGSEHTLGHTLYSRFFVKFLKDIGVVDFEEYAAKRVHHGVILGPDGAKMSKSKGNVVNPDEQVKEYGADAVRMYLAFLGPYDLVTSWNPGGINGVFNFLVRVWRLFENVDKSNLKISDDDLQIMNKTIKKVGDDIETIKFNTAVSSLMEWLNHLSRKGHEGKVSEEEYKVFLKLLAPFAPHMTEELWEMLGERGSIHAENWPEFDASLARSKRITLVVQVNGKVRDKLEVEAGLGQREAEKFANASLRVQKFLGSKKPRKVIYIQDSLINIVI